MLAGGLLLLASLYLPWWRTSCESSEYFQGETTCGLLHYFSSSESTDGLWADVGRAAALFALLSAAVGAVAWVRPRLERRLPLGCCALLACYFGLGVGIETRQQELPGGLAFHYRYGAYVGLAAIMLVLVGAGLARREELKRYRSPSRLVLLALVGGLLVAFLLPWWELPSPSLPDITYIGLGSPAAVVAAALALCLPSFWSRPDTTPEERLGLTGAVALFTGGAAVAFAAYEADRAYGVWPALGIALALVVWALLVERPGRPRLEQRSWRQLGAGAAGALFLGTLFLPWQRWCYDADPDFGPLAGRCISASAWGWEGAFAAVAAVLAIGLVVAVLAPGRLPLSVVELAVGFGVLVVTMGFLVEDRDGQGVRAGYGYGSIIAFVLAAALIVLALMPLRVPRFVPRQALVRSAPIAACIAYLAIIVVPWWGVLPPFESKYVFILPAHSWLTISGALIAIRLLRLWALQAAGASGSSELVLLPLALLALATVDFINQGADAVAWGRGAVVAICLLLALFGQVEERGGLGSVRVPEILRVDRI
jgi:hypothetical protein